MSESREEVPLHGGHCVVSAGRRFAPCATFIRVNRSRARKMPMKTMRGVSLIGRWKLYLPFVLTTRVRWLQTGPPARRATPTAYPRLRTSPNERKHHD